MNTNQPCFHHPNHNNMSMPVITLSSSSKTTPLSSHHAPEIIKNNRDPSFSSFLDGAEETFVFKLGATNTSEHSIIRKNKTDDDREIDVFDAQKYFNEGLNPSPQVGTTKNSSIQHLNKDDPIEIFAIKDRTPIAALSVRSESSWNSRSSLLHTTINPRNHHQPRKGNRKSFLATIGCNCSCADKYSVDIDDDKSSKSTRSRQGDKITSDHNLVRKSQSDYTCVRFDEAELRVNSEGHFSFPVFNSRNHPAKTELKQEEDEFFSSAIKNNGENCLSLEEKLTIMNWDAIAPPGLSDDINIKIPSISSEMHNDSDSDASSDLFEIESFSKGNRYAPSEASVEWSVVTASVADFSVLSDSEEVKPKRVGPNSKTGSSKDTSKARPSILSGCKSQKAVRIVGDAHRSNEQGISNSRRHVVGESFSAMTRFHDEVKVDARSRGQSLDSRVLNQSRSHIL